MFQWFNNNNNNLNDPNATFTHYNNIINKLYSFEMYKI